ncbi:MAG TPA: sialidase family protein, partial [Candidatus Paceibacterota bacterium]
MTTQSKAGVPLLVQEDISLFESSLSEANLIPNGNNIDISHYQIIGPWREQSDGNGENIVSKIYVRNATSTSTTENVIISTGDDYSISENIGWQRTIAQSLNGEIIAIYMADNNPNNSFTTTDVDIRFKTSNDNGDTWSSETDIASSIDISAGNAGGDFTIWIDNTNNVHVVWIEGADLDSSTIKYCKLTYSSGLWSVGTIRTVRSGDSTNYLLRLTLTVQASGRIFVIYNHRNGIFGGTDTLRYKYSDDDGATWNTEASIVATDNNGSFVSVVLRDDNPFLIFCESSSSA